MYTPLSFMKRVLVGLEDEWTVEHTIATLRKNTDYLQTTYGLGPEQFLETILAEEETYFIKGESGTLAFSNFYKPEINDLAYTYLVHSGKPQSTDRICEFVEQKTKLSSTIVQAKLNLEADKRFVQLSNFERWFLVDWDVCNDELYELLVKEQVVETTINELHLLVSSRLQQENQPKKIFIPDIDQRFAIRKKGKVTIQFNSIPKQNNSKISHSSIKEETGMSNNNKVFDAVCAQIKEGIESLRVRDEQMSEEVVQFFKEQNLSAIQALLDEKKECLALREDLSNVLEKWGK